MDQTDGTEIFGNRFTFREIRLRGLVSTGRASQATRLLEQVYEGAPAAPQWQVIERVTTGEVLLAIGDRHNAERALLAAISGAATYRLPHQIQRALRIATRLDVVTAAGQSALDQLRQQLAYPL